MDICDPGKPWFGSVTELNDWCRTANVRFRVFVRIEFCDYTQDVPAEGYSPVGHDLPTRFK